MPVSYTHLDPNALDERHGDTLVVDDQLVIETSEKLEQNLKVLRWFLAPFFALVIVLVTLVTFLLLRRDVYKRQAL